MSGKNILTITEIIDKCTQCKYHELIQLWTPDPFEHELGVFCTRVEDSRSHRTITGPVNYRLVVSDDFNPSKRADIPDWCPRLRRA